MTARSLYLLGSLGALVLAVAAPIDRPLVAEAEAAGGAKAEGAKKEEPKEEKKAEEGKEGEEGKSTEGHAAKVTGPLPWQADLRDVPGCSPEEIAVLRELRQRSLALDAREASLDARETTLTLAEGRVSAELGRLEGMRAEILSLLERTQQVGSDNIVKLAKVVDAMKANDGAELLAGMDEDISLQVLKAVKAKQAAKILGAMEPDKAARLGDLYTRIPDPRGASAAAATASGAAQPTANPAQPTATPARPTATPATPTARPNTPSGKQE